MILGLLSDTHNNDRRTRTAIEEFEERGAEMLLHMGDLTSPDMVGLFDGWPTRIVRGNVDYDIDGIRAVAEQADPTILYDVKHDLELGGIWIGMIHGDDGARLTSMIRSGAFDLVLHGHTHKFRDEVDGGTRIVNPGALHRTREPGVCLYDTDADTLEHVEL